MTIHALDKNLNLVEIPVTYRERPKNSISKLNTFKDGIKVLITIFDLFKDYRPLLFFFVFTSLLSIVSICLFIPILIEFLNTGIVLRFPTLFVSVFLMLAAILSFFSGLILDTVTNNARKDFEFKLKLMKMLYEKK